MSTHAPDPTDLEAARQRHATATATARDAMAQARASREELQRIERRHLEAVAATGDLDACLRESAAAQVATYHPDVSDVIRQYLCAHIPGEIVTTVTVAHVGQRLVLVPDLYDLGSNVPDGADAGLLEVIERFSAVFDYDDEVELPISYYGGTRTLTLTRSTGQAVLTRWDDYSQEEKVVASGPLAAVLQSDD